MGHCVRFVCFVCESVYLCVCMSFGLERMSSMNKTKPTSVLFLLFLSFCLVHASRVLADVDCMKRLETGARSHGKASEGRLNFAFQ